MLVIQPLVAMQDGHVSSLECLYLQNVLLNWPLYIVRKASPPSAMLQLCMQKMDIIWNKKVLQDTGTTIRISCLKVGYDHHSLEQ